MLGSQEGSPFLVLQEKEGATAKLKHVLWSSVTCRRRRDKEKTEFVPKSRVL